MHDPAGIAGDGSAAGTEQSSTTTKARPVEAILNVFPSQQWRLSYE
jgi:hypothetical protein